MHLEQAAANAAGADLLKPVNRATLDFDDAADRLLLKLQAPVCARLELPLFDLQVHTFT